MLCFEDNGQGKNYEGGNQGPNLESFPKDIATTSGTDDHVELYVWFDQDPPEICKSWKSLNLNVRLEV